jgi:tRNA threonylcarbamoyladenosine biosynthesis protein TsaB
MRQVYWGAYQRNAQGLVEAVQAESVLNPSSVPLPSGQDWVGAGSGWDAYAGPLQQRLPGVLARWERGVLPQARHLAVLAAAVLAAGGALAPEEAVPVYVRDDVAARMKPVG